MTQESGTSTTPTPEREPTLFALLGAAARRLSDTVLVAAAGLGTLAMAVTLLLAPQLWRLALLSTAVASFGVWAIVERDRGAAERTRLRRAAQALAATVGVLSFFALALSVLTSALGLWIS